MSAYGALRRRLTSDPAVAAIVGNRVYPMAVPQGAALPAVVYQRISHDSNTAHDGPMTKRRQRYQITSMALDFNEVQRLTGACERALSGRWMDTGDEGEVACTAITRNDLRDEETLAYRVPADYYIWATDNVPA